ncbi:beta-glucuronidase-like [Bradysia coprophila]|uniref:beta-glucuronidase-like n=1 Tax=Bradysia coprophila TaxID=38358 RepID=UPI00187DA1D0|nr:beta-glucuronidase-like [Bradysia coprophila]
MFKLGKVAYIVITACTLIALGGVGYGIYYAVTRNHSSIVHVDGLLYPTESETREVISLDGLWDFAMSDPNSPRQGLQEQWFGNELRNYVNITKIPVPSSYNDLDVLESSRDHVGTVWYERRFFVPLPWNTQRVWLRFGSVHYEANVWINGEHVVQHSFGHLPFEVDVTDSLDFNEENRITVLCDNTLSSVSIPQGGVVEGDGDNGKVLLQQYDFDFFNYAGIHRSVHLYTTPKTYIRNLHVESSVDDVGHGHVNFEIILSDDSATNSANVNILDKDMNVVASQTVDGGMRGVLIINNVRKWWPYLMNPDPGYLYTIEVRISTPTEQDVDIYRKKFGVRTLRWTSTEFLINDRPVYFRGFGKHEDSDIRGKGLDLAILTRDFSLLQWIGANAYRTTHYPYSEESMQFADEHGIMIIDECGFVQTNIVLEDYTEELLQNHKVNMEQLIHRDRDHPSVVMWSIANEPRSEADNADWYFSEIASHTKRLDPTRPITASIDRSLERDKSATYLDVISFNRYNAWYSNPGRLDTITNNVVNEARRWHEKHSKPLMVSEYGGDTLEGLHLLPAFIWTEEFQMELFSKHFEAFDKLRNEGFFIGEFVWNFADFQTKQGITRLNGNKKGVFTRSRQPKAVAQLLRMRYFDLAMEIDNNEDQPSDVDEYISPFQERYYKIEL